MLQIFDTLENFEDDGNTNAAYIFALIRGTWKSQVELIWRQRLSVGKVMYIASRYLVFIDVSIMLLCECGLRLLLFYLLTDLRPTH